MNYNQRVLHIDNVEQAKQELKKINCDPTGVAIMAQKAVFKLVKLEHVPTKAANLLKQTFLAKGGEVALARESAALSIEYTDVLLCATLKQYRLALAQLKLQPWGLPDIAAVIEAVLIQDETFPHRKYVWPHHSLSLKPGKTLVMGILNLTPDSFSDGGRNNHLDAALRQLEQMLQGGADIIDVGVESAKPYGGSRTLSAEEEMQHLLPILGKILEVSPVPVSIDTYRAEVADAALNLGAHMLSNIWGLQHDRDMAVVAAKYKVPVIITHNRTIADYTGDMMDEIVGFLKESIAIAQGAGVGRDQIIVDPGIGFAKTTEHNLLIMSRLEELKSLNCPVLLGSSRKRFIAEVLDFPVEQRVEGTGAAVVVGITKGVHIVRVHDVKSIKRMTEMTDAMLLKQRFFHPFQ
ncbi:hypothetical protein P22_2157 [Propionispora sp. 2/2-37]|uniref:dihydropteroate synthase n=1 Tax=Propionispora sp. 2/2-37 TaxID=1677858 RepID=UPI0006BB6869|nr:dihydropteroate synthase [Propionispora sp. 2/2-37]CUH96069.1 hypothetical protein P22_2157 [Propionispora sp. 2/2-37]